MSAVETACSRFPTPRSALSVTSGSAAQVLGLSMSDVQAQLAKGSASGGEQPQTTASQGGGGGTNPKGANSLTLPDGRSVVLPAGVTEEQVKAIFQKRMSGQEPTAEETGIASAGVCRDGQRSERGKSEPARHPVRGTLHRVRSSGRNHRAAQYQNWTHGPGLHRGGLRLNPEDSVLVLPSASLVQSQQEFKERVTRVTGSGLPGLQSPQQGTSKAPTTTTRP